MLAIAVIGNRPKDYLLKENIDKWAFHSNANLSIASFTTYSSFYRALKSAVQIFRCGHGERIPQHLRSLYAEFCCCDRDCFLE